MDLEITITDILPKGLSYIEDTATPAFDHVYPSSNHIEYIWDLGIIKAKENVVVIFDATIDDYGEYINSATVLGENTSYTPNFPPVFDEDDAFVNVAFSDKPILSYTPEFYDFGEKTKKETAKTTIQIWNSGSGTLTYDLSVDGSWLELSETSGASTGEHDEITITANTTALSLGEYSCYIDISSNAGEETIAISITIVEEQQPVPPTLIISKPGNSSRLYFRDRDLFRFPNTLIIGPITIVAEAKPADATATITKMEVYFDDILKFNDTNSSINFYFGERTFGKHTIKIKAYDSNGLSTEEERFVRIFSLGLKR